MGYTNVIVSRLVELYDPFKMLGLDPDLVDGCGPIGEIEHNLFARDNVYDLGRTAYFRDLFREGAQVDPIEVECRCDRGRVYPEPVLIDGHHRLAGAVLAKADKIRVSFSGRVDLLRYLQGRRKTCPQV